MRNHAGLLLLFLFVVMIFSGCAAHCDRSKNEAINDQGKCYDEDVLPGRPGSRTLQYQTAVYGDKKAAPVLLLHDMNGASWSCLHLGREIAGWDHRVYVPNLFAGVGMKLGEADIFAASRYLAKNPDWQVEKMHDSGPILEDIGCMVREISRRHGGRRVAVIGNCLTGIFPFGVLGEPSVSRAVLCQPATPLSNTWAMLLRLGQMKHRARSLGLSPEVVERSLAAMSRDSTKHMHVFHYAHDPVAPMARITALHERLTERKMAGSMKTYVLKPVDTTSESWWTHTGITQATRKTLSPHSTLVSAECCSDLRWFRDHLRQILSRP